MTYRINDANNCSSGYFCSRLDNREQFDNAFPTVPGVYCPQPTAEPERYPCLMIQAGIAYRSYGPDEMFVVFFYDFEEAQ